MLQVGELLQGALFAHSHPTSLPGSEGWLNRILQSCKIGTATRAHEDTRKRLSAISVINAHK